MARIIALADWSADREPAEDLDPVDPSERTGVTIHHSAGPTSQTVQSIRDYHMDGRGWKFVGYNHLVDDDGLIYEGRGWDYQGAHAAPHNRTHVGFCWIGDGRNTEPSDAAKASMAWLTEEAERRFGPMSVDGHGQLPGQATDCPEQYWRAWIADGMPVPGEQQQEVDVVEIRLDVTPKPSSITLDGRTLRLEYDTSRAPEPPEDPEEPDEPDPQEPDMPRRPADKQWTPVTRHASFTAMGERFRDWLGDDISHDGNGYQPGPVYSEYDDFNVRKVQSLMDNAVDPVGKAYFGPKQWARLFGEDRPRGAELPAELRGTVPPQLRDDEPAPPKPPSVPGVPDADDFTPGTKASWVTLMGERFLAWMKPDEIHKAGSTYTPGPRYSVYDDRNVRVIQALMGNKVDAEGSEFLGPKQWKRLFTEDRPSSASVPDSLKPGGSGSSGGTGSAANVPVEGRRITQHYGNPGSYAAGYHTGVDFGDSGSDAIRAVASGTVVARGSAGAWGNRVIVRHSNGRYSWYCHLRSFDVRNGDKVKRGQALGRMGDTGNSTAKHLHYQESVGGIGYWDHKRPTMLGFGGY